jgi:hypothetical protein
MDTVKDPFGARMVWNPETFDDRRQAPFSVASFREMALICEQFRESFPPSFTKWRWNEDSCPYFIPPKEFDLLIRAWLEHVLAWSSLRSSKSARQEIWTSCSFYFSHIVQHPRGFPSDISAARMYIPRCSSLAVSINFAISGSSKPTLHGPPFLLVDLILSPTGF